MREGAADAREGGQLRARPRLCKRRGAGQPTAQPRGVFPIRPLDQQPRAEVREENILNCGIILLDADNGLKLREIQLLTKFLELLNQRNNFDVTKF